MSAKTETIAALCHLLSHGDEADRCYASRALGRLGDTDALPALIERLGDEDPDVCIDAAEALAGIGDPEAVSPLLEVLQHHPDGEARTAAVEALAKISDPRVPGALLEIAASRPENLAWDDEWDDWWDMQLHAIDALGRMQVTEAVPILERLLEDEENQGIETELLTALARIGGEGLRVIEQRLKHGSVTERRRAATVLGYATSDEAVALLGQSLLDPEAEVRCAGIRSLGAINAYEYLKMILVSLKDPDAEVRSAVVETCSQLAAGALHTEDIASQLIPLLKDENPLVRATTIRTLTSLAITHPLPPEQMEQISLRLSDRDSQVATAACQFLARHPLPQAKDDLLQIASRVGEGIHLRQQAIHALGSVTAPDEDLVEALIHHVTDPEQPIRLEALSALMRLASSREPGSFLALDAVINALQGALETEDNSITAGSEITPNLPPSTSSPSMLSAGIISHSRQSRQATSTLEAIALGSQETSPDTEHGDTEEETGISNEQNSELQEFLELAEENAAVATRREFDVHTDVRLLAARVLATSDKPEVIAALVETLSSNEAALRKEAALSLGHIASRCPALPALKNALGPLLVQLETGEIEVRHACIRTLAKLGSPEVLPHLLKTLQDDSALVRIEAVNGLVELSLALFEAGDQEKLSATEILRQFQGCLTDPSNGVRLAAAKGLVSLLPNLGEESFGCEIIRSITSAAFADHGSQAREMGRILRKIGGETATRMLLQQLETLPTSAERRIVIELLEEILLPEERRLYSA